MQTTNQKIIYTDIEKGLSENEAGRMERNKIGRQHSNLKLFFVTLWRQVASLFAVLLFCAVAVSFVLGQNTDAFIILAIAIINIALGLIQEFRASKASEKLMNLVKSECSVIRDGVMRKISSDEIVAGDIIHLVGGDVVPADVLVRTADNAYIDESVRTGETSPRSVDVSQDVLSGSAIASGRIVGQVTAVGVRASLGQYSSHLDTIKKDNSFDQFIRSVTKYIFIFAGVSIVIAFVILVVVMGKYSLAEYFVFAIALLVGVVPEALPLIITLIMTNEGLALSKEKVIVKKLNGLQELGAARFLLTDKTGTLTENKLKVFEVYDVDDLWNIMNTISMSEYERTPMDEAFDTAINESHNTGAPKDKVVSSMSFSSANGYATFKTLSGKIIYRGKMADIEKLTGQGNEELSERVSGYESRGMRPIGFACGDEHDKARFCGLVVFEDPLKASAKESIIKAHEMGVHIKVVSGDTLAVVEHVASELHMGRGLRQAISLDGKNISDLSNKDLCDIAVFGGVKPEQKLELLNRYLALGPVAFLGEGINDALALKRADVGIVVDNASDVARQSADILLMEKDLSPILRGIEMSRKGLRNVLTYTMYTLSGNAGTFFSLLLISLFYVALPMLPIQILLNNLLTDLPLILLMTDNADESSLKHAPHYHPKKLLKRVIIFGLISTVFDIIYFLIFKNSSVPLVQTGWFVFSVLAELALIFSIRSSRPIFKTPPMSSALSLGMFGAVVLAFGTIYIAPIAHVFKFMPMPAIQTIGIIGLIIIYMFVNETAKKLMNKKNLYDENAKRREGLFQKEVMLHNPVV